MQKILIGIGISLCLFLFPGRGNSSTLSVILGVPGTQLGLEYRQGPYFFQGTAGLVLPLLGFAYSVSAQAGALVGRPGPWSFGLFTSWNILMYQADPAVTLPHYYRNAWGMGFRVEARLTRRLNLALNLPLVGLQWDNRGIPAQITGYYLDFLYSQPLLALSLTL